VLDPIVLVACIFVVLLSLYRLRATFRRARERDRTDELQLRLAELRKKRDEQ
jgi:hypothetical protein